MQASTTKKTQASGRTAAEQNQEGLIRCRAYELYEERGREDGHEAEDWLEAEAEITGKAERAAA